MRMGFAASVGSRNSATYVVPAIARYCGTRSERRPSCAAQNRRLNSTDGSRFVRVMSFSRTESIPQIACISGNRPLRTRHARRSTGIGDDRRDESGGPPQFGQLVSGDRRENDQHEDAADEKLFGIAERAESDEVEQRRRRGHVTDRQDRGGEFPSARSADESRARQNEDEHSAVKAENPGQACLRIKALSRPVERPLAKRSEEGRQRELQDPRRR